MEKYFLGILGSYVDTLYESDSYPKEGDFSHARFISWSAGGCPFNVSAVVAAKGCKVKVVDMLGKDEDTTPFLLQEMDRLHMDYESVQIKEGVTNGRVLIILTGDKRTMFIIDPLRPYYEVDRKMQELLDNAAYIYSLMHMINRSFKDIGPLLEAKRHGARIVLDGSSKYDDPSRVKILYDLADGLFINETDYERLREHSTKDPKEIIFDNGGEFVVITHGSGGSDLYLKDRNIYMPAMDKLDVLDSTGAGDAFAGCFLACLMKGMDYEKALAMATVNGAYACTVIGGLGGVATFEELEAFAKEHGYDL